MPIKKNIPNILSTIRLCMAVLLPAVFLNASLTTSVIYYVIGDATDALDGFLARHWKVQSRYGKIVDPIADKLFNGLMILLASFLVNPWLFTLVGCEIAIVGVTMAEVHWCKQNIKQDSEQMTLSHSVDKSLSVSLLGKVKTIALAATTAATLLAAVLPTLNIVASSLMALTVATELGTIGQYTHQLWQHHRDGQKEKENVTISKQDNKNDELEKLQYIKRLILTLKARESEQVFNSSYDINDVDTIDNEDRGISRTLR